jgi:prolipoprotein diacylglyceryltransferase
VLLAFAVIGGFLGARFQYLAIDTSDVDCVSQMQNWDGAVNYWVLRADF